MEITYNLINEIFKTLPISYYLGRRIECLLDEEGTASYYDRASDNIVVSYPMIRQALSTVEPTSEDFEELTRTILYHEISHVILTPSNMGMTRERNIVEDERIETIFRTHYMNTNFRRAVKLVNNYNGEPARDREEAFYHLVRYRVGEPEWIERLLALLKRYRHINANSYSYDYREDIDKFYRDFMEDYEEKEREKSEDMTNNDSSEDKNTNTETSTFLSDNTEENGGENSNSDSSSNTEDTKEETEMASTSDMSSENVSEKKEETRISGERGKSVEETAEDEVIEEMIDATSIIKEAIKETIDIYNDESLTTKLNTIVDRKLKQNKRNGAAINTYSGQLDKRAVGTRDDYRWWVAQNREGNIKRFSNVHFNLFIDNSGSFMDNDRNMNIFIKSLDKVAKANPKFTFDVITINHEVDEWENHNNIFRSDGGNELTDDIAKIIKKHTKANANNYNIVLFDGDAHSDDFRNYTEAQKLARGTAMDPFRHFNLSNTIIITDEQNRGYIEASIKKARVIYTRHYCTEFIDNICELLEKVV